MAKTQSLNADDLTVSAPQNRSATPQRGTSPKTPSSELEPLQFKMPPEFVQSFKRAALDNKMKLNEFLREIFNEFMKTGK
jgi:hypothetical protein